MNFYAGNGWSEQLDKKKKKIRIQISIAMERKKETIGGGFRIGFSYFDRYKDQKTMATTKAVAQWGI